MTGFDQLGERRIGGVSAFVVVTSKGDHVAPLRSAWQGMLGTVPGAQPVQESRVVLAGVCGRWTPAHVSSSEALGRLREADLRAAS